MNIVEKLAGLIRDTSSSLPPDVEAAIMKSFRGEARGSSASVVLGTILDNVRLARKLGSPLCQDTGTLAFYVDASIRRKVSPAVVKKAVALATARGYLRKNCIDSVTGKSYDDNCADGAPVIHYVDWQKPGCVTLVMKGGGSENMSRQYSLPDASLAAGRDLAGVRKCILDAVRNSEGRKLPRHRPDGAWWEDDASWRQDCVASARARELLRDCRLYVLGVQTWRSLCFSRVEHVERVEDLAFLHVAPANF